MNETNDFPRIGNVYLMEFGGSGSEQRGWRPGLVFQNNVGNIYSPNIIALPLTSSIKKLSQPTHVFLPADETGLYRDSVVLCENPERMSKKRIGRYLTTIPDEYMRQIAAANILATSAISYLNSNDLLTLLEKAIKLNSTISIA